MRKEERKIYTKSLNERVNGVIMKKRLISAILILMMIVTVAIVPVSAAVADQVFPLWDNSNTVVATMTFSDI